MSEFWEKEQIPPTAYLFRYIHKNQVNKQEKKPIPKAMDGGFETSCDWDKYATPEKTRASLARQTKHSGGFKNPDDYFIVQLLVQDIHEYLPSQKVEHDPIQNHEILPDNRAHSLIIGDKSDVEIRLKLVDTCSWAIAPPAIFYD
ncbi:MAG: hypothetical protein AAB316_24180 [Bacteroidota bacterium]